MIYRFDNFVLDTDRAELRSAEGVPVPIERQVFKLLALLAENGDVLTTRDEIIDRVWSGRVISDAAVDSRISAARTAIGDDGKRQARIRTVRGQGLRFVAPVRSDARAIDPNTGVPKDGGRPSIAVLPFRCIGRDGALALLGDALPYELILHLSRLHWLTVVARGSTFRFRDGQPAAQVAAALDARYVLSGTIEQAGKASVVSVMLEDARNGHVVWAERFPLGKEDPFEVKSQIASAIVIELDSQIPMHEALEAQGAGTDYLDAWSNYHLGLMHAYRFTSKDNAIATGHFRQALVLDPNFARAHAGLSFARFQNAFTYYGDDRRAAMVEARTAAERAVELDPRDPFANFNLGRYHWLDHDLDAGLSHLERSVALNPNYAQGLYSLAFTNAISGRAPEALGDVEQSLRLSPLDPLLYGMLGTRALSHLQQGATAEAARWGDRAARAPAAHFLIGMIAVATNEIHGETATAQSWAKLVKRRRPDATSEQFLRSFPFRNALAREQIKRALKKNGF